MQNINQSMAQFILFLTLCLPVHYETERRIWRARRDSTGGFLLFIKHGNGEALITDVSGDIEASLGKGKMTLQLPENYTNAVNARARFGEVYSEFNYTGCRRGHLSIGCTLIDEPVAATRRLFLRIGSGQIYI